MTDYAENAPGYDAAEAEPPDLLGRNLTVASPLFAGATAFFFLAFVFAYFYLRSLNNHDMWHPKGVNPSTTIGTLVMVAIVLSAVVVRLGLADDRAERRANWRLKGAVGLGLGLAAVVLQFVGWSINGFGPSDGGYASVYVGWTAAYLLFVLGSLYWLETLLATAIRYRNVATHAEPPAGEASGDPYRDSHDIAEPLALVRPGLEAFSFYWTFLAVVGVLTWIVLYLL